MKDDLTVINIEDFYSKNPYKAENPIKEGPFALNESLINKAILKYCEMWNKDEKSRGFIKHILHSFIPINPLNKVLNFGEEKNRRCAILGIKCASVREIADAWAKIMVEEMPAAFTGESKEKILEKRKLLTKNMPIEVRNGTVAYMSDSSQKILSGEAIAGLDIFLTECLFRGDSEINYSLTKIRYEQMLGNKGFTEKEVESVARMAAGDKPCLDDATLEKLRNLRDSMEEKK